MTTLSTEDTAALKRWVTEAGEAGDLLTMGYALVALGRRDEATSDLRVQGHPGLAAELAALSVEDAIAAYRGWV